MVAANANELLRARGVVKLYRTAAEVLRVLDGVDLTLY